MKKTISANEFQKKVEIESAHLQYYNHLSKTQADKSAQENISQNYIVE